jgi:hypothetical protein
MTKDCIRRNSRKETRSYYTILDTRSSAKENYKVRDGPYIVHLVSPSGAVTIMDAKGDQHVVNGQQLKVFLSLTLCLLNTLTSTPWMVTRIIKAKR